jgi:hypothetical protein
MNTSCSVMIIIMKVDMNYFYLVALIYVLYDDWYFEMVMVYWILIWLGFIPLTLPINCCGYFTSSISEIMSIIIGMFPLKRFYPIC